MRIRRSPQWLVLLFALAVSACEIPGLEDGTKAAEAKEADGRAIGGACRHSGRALEDCYVMNPRALKAAIYAGWRDMDAYMRENDIKPVVPDLVDPPTGGVEEKPASGAAGTGAKPAAKRSSVTEVPDAPLPRRFS